MIKKILNFPDKLISQLLIGCIRVYQRTISPDHSALGKTEPFKGCKFYPSCSQYAVESLEKKGIWSLPKIVWRVLRCNPWSKGGIDKP